MTTTKAFLFSISVSIPLAIILATGMNVASGNREILPSIPNGVTPLIATYMPNGIAGWWGDLWRVR